jgi:hypothetical protein
MSDPIAAVADRLMRAVAATGVIKPDDADIACRVMREELKEFIAGDKYADERALLSSPGGEQLAFASLVATCVSRILVEEKLQPLDA